MKQSSWKRQRKEFIVGFGVSNFLGDLGGKDRIGTDYSYADLELSLTRPTFTIGYRYRLKSNMALRSDFSYLKLSGSDQLTQDPYRNNRNLSFRSNVFELSTNFEYAFFKDKGGNRYALKKTLFSRYKTRNSYGYVSIGLGAFWFNPKARYEGKWYALHNLSTEGQGLPGGPRKYYRIAVCIPLAVGIKFALSKKFNLGIEYNFRKTFTDYIDDVHGRYYDKDLLLQYKGPVAVALSDPNLGKIENFSTPDGAGRGAQRGDKQKDSYMALEIKLGMYLQQKGKRYHKRTRAKF